MTIIAVRHTSVSVPEGMCYGHTDVETSGTFGIEKEQVAEKLLSENFQVIYSSPLARCRKLAESVSKGLPVYYDSRLLELNFGRWEGCTWQDIEKTDEAKLWFTDWMNIPCPGGESYKQLITRVQDFLKHISLINYNILLITHGGVIRALISLMSGIDPRETFELEIDYGSLVKLYTRE
jgi:alpha-ribazole phosphatase